MPAPRTAALLGATLLVGATGWLAAALPAAAHVTVSPSTGTAGAPAVLTFSLSHGCEGSPTTGLAIQLPDGVEAATPTLKPGWEVQKVMTELEEPRTDSHGNQVTERVDRVEYRTDDPVPDGYRDTFEVQLTVGEDAAGQTLALPAVQTCEQGENRWVQVAAEGQDPHDLESPAPTLTVPEGSDGTAGAHGHEVADGTQGTAGAEGHGAGTGPDAGTEGQPEGTAAATGSGGSGTGLGVAGLVAGLAGLAAGVTALVRVRPRTP